MGKFGYPENGVNNNHNEGIGLFKRFQDSMFFVHENFLRKSNGNPYSCGSLLLYIRTFLLSYI